MSFTLTNRGAGHRIPTGDYGYREMRVAVELLDSEGQTVGQAHQAVLPGQDGSLAPAVATEFTVQLAPPPNRTPQVVRVLVERVNGDRSFQYTLAESEWPIRP